MDSLVIIQSIEKGLKNCKVLSHSSLVQSVRQIFLDLEDQKAYNTIENLKNELIPLGLDPKSENFGWLSEPDKNQLIMILTNFTTMKFEEQEKQKKKKSWKGIKPSWNKDWKQADKKMKELASRTTKIEEKRREILKLEEEMQNDFDQLMKMVQNLSESDSSRFWFAQAKNLGVKQWRNLSE